MVEQHFSKNIVHEFSTYNISQIARNMNNEYINTYIPLIYGVTISIGRIFVLGCFGVVDVDVGMIVKSKTAKNGLKNEG